MRPTHTKISRPPDYDGDVLFDRTKNTAIAQMISKAIITDFSQPLTVCEKCGGPVQKDIELLGIMRRVSMICRCRAAEIERDKQRTERQEAKRRIDKFREYSLMDGHFSVSTFENWVLRDDNKKLYEFGKRYCDNWNTVYSGNHGLLLHGGAGSGKTFLSFAIANELNKCGHTVLAISVSHILRIIMDSYRQHGDDGELDIMKTIGETGLLILDDLGVEHKTAWSYEKLYTIIDTRYRAKKPTIITTNLRIDGEINELRDNLSVIDAKSQRYDSSDRIYNRIVEMCAFFEISGKSWRIQKGEENKSALLSKLGF